MKLRVLIILVLILSTMMISVSANEDTVLHPAEVNEGIESTSTMISQKKSLKLATMDYNNMLMQVSNIDLDGTTYKYEVMGEEIEGYSVYPISVRVLMRKQKFLFPEQLKLQKVSTELGYKITKNSLEMAARDIYLGLYSAYRDNVVKDMQYETAKLKFESTKEGHRIGMSTDLDLEIAEYDLKKAKNDAKAAIRSLENMSRSYNAFVGKSITIIYEDVQPESLKYGMTKNVDFYIEEALNNRIDIYGSREGKRLTELEMEILEFKNSHLDINRDRYEELEKLLIEQQIALEIALNDVEQEIKKAYLDVLESQENVASMQKLYDNTLKRLNNYKKQYENGFVSELVIKDLEAGLEQTLTGLNVLIIQHNTKLMKFKNAINEGPEYFQVMK